MFINILIGINSAKNHLKHVNLNQVKLYKSKLQNSEYLEI